MRLRLSTVSLCGARRGIIVVFGLLRWGYRPLFICCGRPPNHRRQHLNSNSFSDHGNRGTHDIPGDDQGGPSSNIDAVTHAAEPKHQVERLHRGPLAPHPLQPDNFVDAPQVPVVWRFGSDMPPQEFAVGATVPYPTIMLSPTTTIRHDIGVQRPHFGKGPRNLHS